MAAEGTFILADIGGYTSFLTGVGIEHAKEAIEHLLNRLIKTNQNRWKVANVMGDCVFFYTPAPEHPEDTYDGLRSLYHAFQDARLDIASGSTCRCGACDRTEELSLKFVVHAGEYDMQNIAGRKELIGQDVVLATRLLKNSVPVREYVITTPPVAAVAHAAGVAAAQGRDELEGIGLVEYSYVDLEAVREAHRAAREFYLTDEDSKLTVNAEIEAPPDVVWAAMSDLSKRAVWQVTIKRMEHIQGESGGVGEVHSCLHADGSRVLHQTIAIDHDGRRKTERVWVSPPIMKDTYITLEAAPISENRTLASLRGRFKPRWPVVSHALTPVFIWMMKRSIRQDMDGLKEFCETGRVATREAEKAETGHPAG